MMEQDKQEVLDIDAGILRHLPQCRVMDRMRFL